MSQEIPTTKIIFIPGKIKRASIKPNSTLIISIEALDGEVYEDKFTIRGSLTTKSFKLFTEMQKHLDSKEKEEGVEEVEIENLAQQLSEEDIGALVDLFPEFFMSMVLHSEPLTTIEDVVEFDTMLKLSMLGILVNNMNIEQQVESFTKK